MKNNFISNDTNLHIKFENNCEVSIFVYESSNSRTFNMHQSKYCEVKLSNCDMKYFPDFDEDCIQNYVTSEEFESLPELDDVCNKISKRLVQKYKELK